MREAPRFTCSLFLFSSCLLAATLIHASEPESTDPSPAPSAVAPGLLPARFTAADFSTLTEAKAARCAAAFPRLTAFLESRRAEVEAAQAKASKHSMPASRAPALSALESWLTVNPSPEARAPIATYLTIPPADLLRDTALLYAAAEEAKLHEQVLQIQQETATEHAQLDALANDQKLPLAERDQLKRQLADLAKSEADMQTTGQNVPPEAVALAVRYKDHLDQWSKWNWPKK